MTHEEICEVMLKRLQEMDLGDVVIERVEYIPRDGMDVYGARGHDAKGVERGLACEVSHSTAECVANATNRIGWAIRNGAELRKRGETSFKNPDGSLKSDLVREVKDAIKLPWVPAEAS